MSSGAWLHGPGGDGVCRAGAHIPRQYPPLVSGPAPPRPHSQASVITPLCWQQQYSIHTSNYYTLHHYTQLTTHEAVQHAMANVIVSLRLLHMSYFGSSLMIKVANRLWIVDSVNGMFGCVMTINSDKRSEWRVTPLPLAVPPRTSGQKANIIIAVRG